MFEYVRERAKVLGEMRARVRVGGVDVGRWTNSGPRGRNISPLCVCGRSFSLAGSNGLQ